MAGYSISVNSKWCKHCGICVANCSKEVFAMTEKKKMIIQKEDECVGCKLCEYRCPDLALTVGKEGA